jgi:pyruvate/oxaloacetate carboxyltransferase
VVRQFIERCAENGVSVFRIFDAMNDMRNLKTAVDQTVKLGLMCISQNKLGDFYFFGVFLVIRISNNIL